MTREIRKNKTPAKMTAPTEHTHWRYTHFNGRRKKNTCRLACRWQHRRRMDCVHHSSACGRRSGSSHMPGGSYASVERQKAENTIKNAELKKKYIKRLN